MIAFLLSSCHRTHGADEDKENPSLFYLLKSSVLQTGSPVCSFSHQCVSYNYKHCTHRRYCSDVESRDSSGDCCTTGKTHKQSDYMLKFTQLFNLNHLEFRKINECELLKMFLNLAATHSASSWSKNFWVHSLILTSSRGVLP